MNTEKKYVDIQSLRWKNPNSTLTRYNVDNSAEGEISPEEFLDFFNTPREATVTFEQTGGSIVTLCGVVEHVDYQKHSEIIDFQGLCLILPTSGGVYVGPESLLEVICGYEESRTSLYLAPGFTSLNQQIQYITNSECSKVR
jgi:hypothetical protein